MVGGGGDHDIDAAIANSQQDVGHRPSWSMQCILLLLMKGICRVQT